MGESFPVGSTPIQEEDFNALRIKVTDKCQWQCSFCHNEGDIATSDLQWGPKMEEAVKILREKLPTITEMHFTGGEPTAHPGLAAVAAGLTALGFEVKATTNGQISRKTLRTLYDAGLKSFNFSVHSFSPERFLKFQTGRGKWWQERGKKAGDELPSSNIPKIEMTKIKWAQQQIDRQKEMMAFARSIGAEVRMNSVISDVGDLENAREIFKWAEENKIPLRLLNDLSNGMTSINAIRQFITETGATEVLRKITRGASTCRTVYRTASGYEFSFKQIRDFKLESMCNGCPRADDGTCEEQFYGIRIQEGTSGDMQAILCIQESRPETQMALEKFLSSDQLREIQKYLE